MTGHLVQGGVCNGTIHIRPIGPRDLIGDHHVRGKASQRVSGNVVDTILECNQIGICHRGIVRAHHFNVLQHFLPLGILHLWICLQHHVFNVPVAGTIDPILVHMKLTIDPLDVVLVDHPVGKCIMQELLAFKEDGLFKGFIP